jgi:hypothetical protein
LGTYLTNGLRGNNMSKFGATEAQVGRIHKLASDIYELKLQGILDEMKSDPENAQHIGDLRTIQAGDKWAQYNEIKTQLPTEDVQNELSKTLAEVKSFKLQISPTLEKEA